MEAASKPVVVVFAEERAVVGGLRGYFGSVISYSLKCNAESPNLPQFHDDPIAKVERAILRGEKLHWFNRSSSVIADPASNESREALWAKVKVLAFGDVVCLEGRFFKLAPDHNRNVALIPADAEEYSL